ncbi:hypothetical protein [Piscinibacter koreensis]|uniref:Uncharacterized protein n=1 Tax=Piscinibacter koreensis TaxID=2742824 RepID=A0A7Y6TZ62_9BURK|nr:hypothetical protein [Schlegelella koreensis]NUZ09004.1 hypothetical protein [Schlegelella koreensis]
MSAKRPAVDLMALTSEQAVPMAEALQRTATPADVVPEERVPAKKVASSKVQHVGTANLEALAFKVPPSFRKRFRSRAAEADMKLNELLFAAFDAWEKQQQFKK